jgi:HEAT repeat protein
MSPEQADDRPVDQSADQYALGCILFEMLTGKVPYDHPSSATNILVQHLSAPIPSARKVCPGAKIPEPIDELVRRMLAKRREDRYPSLAEVAAVLVSELLLLAPEESPQDPSAVSLGGRFSGRTGITTKVVLRPRRWQLWAAAAGVLGLVATVGYLGVQRWQQGRGVVQAVPIQVVQELRGQALGVLKERLRASAAPVRQQAVEGLGKARDVSQRTSIEPLLADPVLAVQVQAAEALGQLGDRAATTALKDLLGRSSEPNVRAAAAAALDLLGDEDGPRLLRQMLDGRDEQGRFRAAYLLCEKGDRKAVAVLSEILERGAPPDEVAVDLLARLAQAGEESARKALLQRLGAADQLPRRLVLARRLAQIGEPRGKQVLTELAGRAGPEQLLASRLLASPEEPGGGGLFRRVLAERAATQPEQLLAIEGLGLSGQLADLLLLRPHLLPTASERLRLVAAIAVLQLAAAAPGVMSEQSLAWAQGALRDGNWLVRQSAVAVLGDAPGDRATQLLLPLLKDADARVRRGTVKALWRRPPSRELLASLRVMLFDGDGGVREETLQAFLRVGRGLQKQGAKGLPAELAGWFKELLAGGTAREQLLARTVLYKLGDENQSTALRSFQTSSDRELRRLYVHEQDGSAEGLLAALGDADPVVRLLAAQKLAERGDGHGLSLLREALAAGGPGGLVAYGLLRKLGQPAELPADASELLSSPRVEARMEAVETLGKLPPEIAVPLLLEAARDPERLVRRLVAEVAAELPTVAGPSGAAAPAGAVILRHLQQDLDAGVRFRATVLLLRFGTLPPPTAADFAAAARRDKPRPPAVAAPVPDAGAPPSSPDAGVPPSPPDAGVAQSPGPESPPPAVESPLEKLAHAGLAAFARKDYTIALKQMDKAARECAKGRKSELACAALSTELPLRIGQIYEQRGDLGEAMAEYEKAQRAGHRLKGRPELVAAVAKAASQLAGKLGAVVRPKGSGESCKEVTTWLEPGGPYTFTVDGRSQVVNVRAGETIKLGECH